MDSILGMLASQLGGGTVGTISQQLGVDDQKAQQVIGMALPVLIGALNRNASSSGGAQALTNALQRDHDGSILNNLSQTLTNPETLNDGTAILGHVLGENRGNIVNSISRATKMDPAQIEQIFAILAPLVMGALGQLQRKQSLDAQGVSSLLQNERSSAEKSGSGLTQLLDMNGDGDVTQEIISLGSSLLGGLFGGNK
jgi:hypothetical protein